MTVEELKTEAERLIEICSSAQNIYIYGAGEYAKCIFYYLRSNSLNVLGFITSFDEGKDRLGKPLMTKEEYCKVVRKDDLIIPGYRGCSRDILLELFHAAVIKPQIANVDPIKVKTYYFNHVMKEFHDYIKQICNASIGKQSDWNNILIIRLDAIGDLVCTTAFLREIRHNNPTANITVAVNSRTKALIESCPYINSIIPCLPNEYGEDFLDDIINYKKIEQIVKDRLEIQDEHNKYDVAILSAPVLGGRRSVESLIYMILCGASERIGYCYGPDKEHHEIFGNYREFFSKLYFIDKPMHETEFQLELLRRLGMTINSEKNELWVNGDDADIAEQILNQEGIQPGDIIIGVGIVGSKERRNWSRENYRILITSLAAKKKNLKWVIFGGKDAVRAASELADIDNVIDFTGRLSLEQTVACMAKSVVYIGANTGLMHIAAALGIPCITIYSVLKEVSPWDGNGPVRFGAKDTVHIDMIPEKGLDGCQGSCKASIPHCINQIKPFDVERELLKLLCEFQAKRTERDLI